MSIKQFAHPKKGPTLWGIIFAAFVGVISLLATYSAFTKEQTQGEFKTPPAFVSEAFQGQPPEISAIWIKGDLKKKVAKILGHPYHKLRVKYWIKANRSVWVLDEIGKEKPITTGIIIERNHIQKVEVLAFRESRGWEVKYPFFTEQFKNISINSMQDTRLNKNIDGITGATLSVKALSVQARMALFLDQHIRAKASK